MKFNSSSYSHRFSYFCALTSYTSVLQAPWDSTDHTSPAHHMFNESDPILGPSTLETGFLEEEDEEAQGGDRGGEEGGTLEECLGLPPSSPPSHPSAGDSVEPLSSSYMLFKVGFTSLCPLDDSAILQNKYKMNFKIILNVFVITALKITII